MLQPKIKVDLGDKKDFKISPAMWTKKIFYLVYFY